MTEFIAFDPRAFELLDALAANNEKAWYDANRPEFEAELRVPFAQMLEAITERLEGSIAPLIGSKRTMFRQNRDVRFSKDKSLYKTQPVRAAFAVRREGGGCGHSPPAPRCHGWLYGDRVLSVPNS